jgi:hypothetical protein
MRNSRTRASSPSSCRRADARLRLFAVLDDDRPSNWRSAPSTTSRATAARKLADQYNLGSQEPNIQVWNVDLRGDRALTLRYFPTSAARCRPRPRRCCATWPPCGASGCGWSSRAPMARSA